MSDKLTKEIQQAELELQKTIDQLQELQGRGVYLRGYLQGLQNQQELEASDDSEAPASAEEKE